MTTITDKETAQKHLNKWFKNMGFAGTPQYQPSGRHHGQDQWGFNVAEPYGFYMVHADGTVEDNYGTFGAATQLYDVEGDAINE
jgi:hypothetical protein